MDPAPSDCLSFDTDPDIRLDTCKLEMDGGEDPYIFSVGYGFLSYLKLGSGSIFFMEQDPHFD